MEADFGRADMVSSAVPLFVMLLLALGLLAAWVGLHLIKARFVTTGRTCAVALALLAAVGTLAMWSVFQCLGRGLLLATPWRLWACAILGALGVESVVALYALECGILSRRNARIISGLRIAMVILVTVILVQPVLSLSLTRTLERQVVVMVDDSQSMHFEDREWSLPEKLALADLYNLPAVAGRFKTDTARQMLTTAAESLGTQIVALNLPTGGSDDAVRALLGSRREALKHSLRHDIADAIDAGRDRCESAEKYEDAQSATVVAALNAAATALKTAAQPNMKAALKILADDYSKTPAPLLDKLISTLGAIEAALTSSARHLSTAECDAGEALYAALSPAVRAEIEQGSLRTRADIARQIIVGEHGDQPGLIAMLQEDYAVKPFRFATRVEPMSLTPDLPDTPTTAGETTNVASIAFRATSDLAGALESALKDVPPENLAGVLLLSDGRHNGPSGVEAVARRYGAQGVPIVTVAVGTVNPPRDAAVVGLRAPESIFLNDRVSVRADLKLDGLQGESVRVTLIGDGAVVEEKQVDIPESQFRTTLRFSHTPETDGIQRYRIEIETKENERFEQNNVWPFDVAVSDDRTNVLLIDYRPRWEFRYLRNLFYGRDKSVHLQNMLTNPDRLRQQQPADVVHASAGRRFGDSEANALPDGLDEWLKFDAIILGDVDANLLDADALEAIRYCVEERGALLVVIAGPHAMPHAHQAEILRDLLPATYTPSSAPVATAPEVAFRFTLTPEGRHHAIMQQSSSSSENQLIWEGIPPMHWRHPALEAKEGATVLAYAEPIALAAEPDTSLDSAAARLEELVRRRQRNALVVEQVYGRGHVLLLTSDRSWRLRYRVGDTYHHRFWGQILRWGTGENLRAGTDRVRLGTDMLTYTPQDPIRVMAKLIDPDSRPVNNATVTVFIYDDTHEVMRKRLTHREASNGMYEETLAPFEKPGHYRLLLKSPDADRLLLESGVEEIATEFTVLATKTPVELAELSMDSDLLRHLSELSGGETVAINELHSLRQRFGPGSQRVQESKETSLWDTWPFLLLLLGCVAAEWLMRRKAGLP
jgi:hypothetical protein